MLLDHCYICVEDPTMAEQLLTDFGLQFTLHAEHPGQGTRNACAFFENAYFELLICVDANLLESPVVGPLGLRERFDWRCSGASPFGVAFRGASSGLETWPYHAPFLPDGLHLPIATPTGRPDLPMIFLIPPHLPIQLRSATAHRGAPRNLTRLDIYGPRMPADLVPANAVLAAHTAPSHHLQMQWDHGIEGRSHDFRPALPLTIHW
jgi:hypothetical protein